MVKIPRQRSLSQRMTAMQRSHKTSALLMSGSDCTGGLISDLSWSNLLLTSGTGFAGTNIKALTATCSSGNLSSGATFTVSGTGLAYGSAYESDTAGIIDWATAPACAGTAVSGLCWYLGSTSQSCDDVCAINGGVHLGTWLQTGSEGGNAECGSVLNALGIAGTAGTEYSATTYKGLGCFYNTSSLYLGRNQSGTTTSGSAALARRACACNQ